MGKDTDLSEKIIDFFKSFNRKERFHLVGKLLGNKDFILEPEVLEELVKLLQLKAPSNYFSAMDYHIDWIFASLALSFDEDALPRKIEEGCIKATQEDIDFLVAFVDDSGFIHIIMIEAKGDTLFTNKQLKSKAERLKIIFGDDGQRWEKVKPHFVLCSPKLPSRLLKLEKIPKFMLNQAGKFNWMRLQLPPKRMKVTRCDENGKPSINGTFWKTDDIK